MMCVCVFVYFCVCVSVCLCVCYRNLLYSLIKISTLATFSVRIEFINVCIHLYFVCLKV